MTNYMRVFERLTVNLSLTRYDSGLARLHVETPETFETPEIFLEGESSRNAGFG